MTSETDDTEEEVYVVGPNGPHMCVAFLCVYSHSIVLYCVLDIT